MVYEYVDFNKKDGDYPPGMFTKKDGSRPPTHEEWLWHQQEQRRIKEQTPDLRITKNDVGKWFKRRDGVEIQMVAFEEYDQIRASDGLLYELNGSVFPGEVFQGDLVERIHKTLPGRVID